MALLKAPRCLEGAISDPFWSTSDSFEEPKGHLRPIGWSRPKWPKRRKVLTKILTILGSKEGEDYRGEWSSPRGVKIFPISKIHAYLNSNFPMRLFLSGKIFWSGITKGRCSAPLEDQNCFQGFKNNALASNFHVMFLKKWKIEKKGVTPVKRNRLATVFPLTRDPIFFSDLSKKNRLKSTNYAHT